MNVRILAAALLLAAGPAFASDKAPELKVGYRALAMSFPSHQLRYIEPGDRVDVMTTFSALMGKKDDTTKEDVTATILQNVIVLAVDRKFGVVQLELNPNEAQYAALFAAPDKTMWLSKRAKGDTEMHPMEMASAKKLFR